MKRLPASPVGTMGSSLSSSSSYLCDATLSSQEANKCGLDTLITGNQETEADENMRCRHGYREIRV